MTTRIDRRIIVALPVVILVLDQLLKIIMVQWIGPESEIHRRELLGSALAFEYLENRGAAFGIMPDQTELLTAASILIAIFGVMLLWREATAHPVTAVAIGMIVGGAIGNIVDRVRLGYVVDFVAVGIWPRFNLADSMISIGVVLLLWSAFHDERTVRETPHGVATDGK